MFKMRRRRILNIILFCFNFTILRHFLTSPLPIWYSNSVFECETKNLIFLFAKRMPCLLATGIVI